nr:DUF3054 domain-containing protein [Angustibacter aerolatus]
MRLTEYVDTPHGFHSFPGGVPVGAQALAEPGHRAARGVRVTGGRRVLAAAAADVVCVVAFAATGRRSHAEGLDLVGTAGTAAPFLGGLALGWLAGRGWREPLSPLRTGVPAWVGAVAGGMVLRRVTGEGTAPSFVVVASVVLGATLVGWRGVAAAVRRRSAS